MYNILNDVMTILYYIILLELNVHSNPNSFPYLFIISSKSYSTYPYLSHIYIYMYIYYNRLGKKCGIFT